MPEQVDTRGPDPASGKAQDQPPTALAKAVGTVSSAAPHGTPVSQSGGTGAARDLQAIQVPQPSLELDGLPRDLSGLRMAVVGPSGHARDVQSVTRAFDALRARGVTLHDYSGFSNPDVVFQRFAASDQERLAQLHQAARDDEVEVVMALRGGYGLTRLLPELDFALLADSGKLFVGHSDFTALQMGLLARGSRHAGFAGPMVCGDFAREQVSAFTMQRFWQCLSGPSCRLDVVEAGNPELLCEGRLWGGNLAMLCSLLGTPWMPRIDGGILFLEEVGEHPYRIERMLLQLAQAGVLETQSAVLLGSFTAYRLGEFENGYDFAAMLAYLRDVLPVPLVTGLPFGHIVDKVTLPVGASARLHCHRESWSLSVENYPCLSSARS